MASTFNDAGSGFPTWPGLLRDMDVNRASGRLAYHVLDAMVSLIESAEKDEYVHLTSTVQRPPAVQRAAHPA